MTKIKTSLFLLLLFLLLEGCANKSYTQEARIFLIFKTKTIKYADLAFMYEGKDKIKIEMYSNGQALQALEIGKTQICVSRFECLSEEAFNEKVLSASYPKDILVHILKGDKIFASKNLRDEEQGFRQILSKAGHYEIDYRVTKKTIVFRDTFNAIVIKVKKIL